MSERLCIRCCMVSGVNNNCDACLKKKVDYLKECIKWRESERDHMRRGIYVGFAPWRSKEGKNMPMEVIKYMVDYIYIKVPCCKEE